MAVEASALGSTRPFVHGVAPGEPGAQAKYDAFDTMNRERWVESPTVCSCRLRWRLALPNLFGSTAAELRGCSWASAPSWLPNGNCAHRRGKHMRYPNADCPAIPWI